MFVQLSILLRFFLSRPADIGTKENELAANLVTTIDNDLKEKWSEKYKVKDKKDSEWQAVKDGHNRFHYDMKSERPSATDLEDHSAVKSLVLNHFGAYKDELSQQFVDLYNARLKVAQQFGFSSWWKFKHSGMSGIVILRILTYIKNDRRTTSNLRASIAYFGGPQRGPLTYRQKRGCRSLGYRPKRSYQYAKYIQSSLG